MKEALEVFYGVREIQGLKKKPSTSELLDWLKILMSEQITPADLNYNRKNRKIPQLHGALLKNEQDVQLFDPASRRSAY